MKGTGKFVVHGEGGEKNTSGQLAVKKGDGKNRRR